MNKDVKIYIAGHQGLVGSAIMRQLVGAGYTNIVVRTFAELDLRRQADVENFFDVERPKYVILAAAKVGGILANSTYKAEFIYDNLMIASNVIHTAYKYDVKRLINLGSSCIYPKDAPQPLKEDYLLTGPLEETNEPYAIAKIAAIKLCRYYNEQYGTQFLSLMPTNLYGPDDNFNLETSHVLPALLRKFRLATFFANGDLQAIWNDVKCAPLGWGLEKELNAFDDIPRVLAKLGIFTNRIELWGSGEVYREFLYVDDLAEIVGYVLESTDVSGFGSDCLLNVGSGEDISIKELAKMVAILVDFRGDIKFDSEKPTGVRRKLLDVRGIRNIGLTHKVNLMSGIEKMLKVMDGFVK